MTYFNLQVKYNKAHPYKVLIKQIKYSQKEARLSLLNFI